MREQHVLSSCIKDRAAYEAIQAHVEHQDLSEQGLVIWNGITNYYEADTGANMVDAGILADQIAHHIPVEKHKEMFRGIVHTLAESESSPPNVVQDLLTTKRLQLGQRLAAELLGGSDASALIEEYMEVSNATRLDDVEEEEDARQGFSVEELCAVDFNADNLINVYPTSLNDRLGGGVKPGHHITIFARPEMGKTMLTIEMMAGFARQGLTTLYIGNEDPIADINMRVVNRLSGMTKLEVINAPGVADKKCRDAEYENIILKGMAPGTPREITKLIETYMPDVLVLDQLRNLNMGQDNYVLALEQAAKQARQWAKRYSCVVVSVTQAGDSGAGKAVLDMGDVDFSNTGIPSQCDVMIAMGATEKQLAENERVLSLPRNKVSGRHEYFSVSVDPTRSSVLPM